MSQRTAVFCVTTSPATTYRNNTTIFLVKEPQLERFAPTPPTPPPVGDHLVLAIAVIPFGRVNCSISSVYVIFHETFMLLYGQCRLQIKEKQSLFESVTFQDFLVLKIIDT